MRILQKELEKIQFETHINMYIKLELELEALALILHAETLNIRHLKPIGS